MGTWDAVIPIIDIVTVTKEEIVRRKKDGRDIRRLDEGIREAVRTTYAQRYPASK